MNRWRLAFLSRRVFCLMVLMLLAAGPGPASGGAYDAWNYRMKIRLAGYDRTETLTNFPVLVTLNTNTTGFLYSDFNSLSDGADLRFVSSNGTVELNYEIEKWDTNGSSYVWVQLPALTSTNDYIYAYWGNATNAPSCKTNGATWTNGFVGVWHLNGIGSVVPDSSTNLNSATNNGAIDASGVIAGGVAVDNSSAYVNIPHRSTHSKLPLTVSGWVRSNVLGQGDWKSIISKYLDSSANGWSIDTTANGYYFYYFMNAANYVYPGGNGIFFGSASTNWAYLAAVVDQTGVTLYLNGVHVASQPWTGTAGDAPQTADLRLGCAANTGLQGFDGDLDDFSLANSARSSNWVWACWLNQASNSAFLAFSEAGSTVTSLTVTANAATGLGETTATINGRVVHTGGGPNPDVYFCWGYTDGGTSATSSWAHVDYIGASWGAQQSFSTNLTGLLSGSNYTYRCYVTNTAGYDWSGSAASFRTLALPVVTNLGASSLGAQTATLRGQVTDSGGDTPYTWFYYWIDGQATTTTVAKGTQSGVFTEALSGLLLGSNYTYRCAASNVIGMTWSGDTSFTTVANEYIWTGGGSDNSASTPGNWLQGSAPTHATDLVRLNSSSSKDMTWDLTNAVAAWTQTSDYAGTVTILTTYGSGFPVMAVTGDCQVLGGTWTHLPNGATEDYRIRALIGGDFTLGSAAAVNINVKGYGRGLGPGAGDGWQGNAQPAASYGGMGGDAFNPTYGSYTAPTNLGSSATTIGGGAVWLTVGGTATINGTITARPNSDLAQGSGGSIFVQAGALAGSGTLDVSCPYNWWIQRGGGGGRIAVILATGSSFGSIRMYANGGQSQDAVSGAAGTIYLQTSAQAEGTGTLIIDNAGISTLTQTKVTPLQSDLNTLSALIITNKGVLGLNTNTALNLGSASLLTYGPSQSFIATPQTEGMQLPATWQLQNCTLQVYTNLEVDGSLTITNATLEVFSSMATNVHIGTNLSIASGGILTHGPNGASETYRLAMSVGGNLTIEAGGSIDVTGKGYTKSEGPGRGYGSNNNYLPGASYGGLGCEYPTNDWYITLFLPYWTTYGSIVSPTNLGSGAYWYGGGAAEIHVGGTTTLSGSILAKGYPVGMAGNSGGSIYLTTASLAGNGMIDASANYTDQYGGGGGRIAVVLTSSSSFDSVIMRAFGAGNYRGAAGTIYRETESQRDGHGILTISGDAAPYTTNTVTQLPPSTNPAASDISSLKFVTLVATNYANVVLTSDLTMGNLFLTGDNVKLYLRGHTLTLKSSYHADWGTESRVVYDGGRIVWALFGTVFVVH